MITIELNNRLQINGTHISFPVIETELNKLFGNNRLSILKYGKIFTWDKVGIIGRSSDGKTVDNLFIYYAQQSYEFSPKTVFKGQILINNQEITNYRRNNIDSLVKLFKQDKGCAFILNDIRCWFDMDGETVTGIEIDKFDGKIYENPILKKREPKLDLDEKYAYLIPVWNEWKDEVEKIVSIDNDYHNLIQGISNKEATLSATINDEIIIPNELVGFYKIYNVEYNVVASCYSFSVNGWEYYLLPFNDIKKHWENIQDLYFEDSLENNNLERYSDKIKANDYANPRWFPFAEGKNGDYLLFDTDPSEKGKYGQIIELQNESWERNVVAGSLLELLQNEITSLKKGEIKKYDFILKNR